MSQQANELQSKTHCPMCNRKIPKRQELSSIEFRRNVNEIKNTEDLKRLCEGKYMKVYYPLLKQEDKINFDTIMSLQDTSIDEAKLHLLTVISSMKEKCLEMGLYRHIHDKYLRNGVGIDETFSEFYSHYVQTVKINTLTKHSVARALSAIGLKTTTKNVNGRFCTYIYILKDELFVIFKKNGLGD